MKLITLLFISILLNSNCLAEVYTFHTQGDYQNEDNWDVYPGMYLTSNDTISFEANCSNIYLEAFDGYLVFSEECTELIIMKLAIFDDCQVEFLAQEIVLNLDGFIDFDTTNEFWLPDSATISINNYGGGITMNYCPIWQNATVYYYNGSAQDESWLECGDGDFYNDGIIYIFEDFTLNCNLDLGSGTINGVFPFEMEILNGSISQECSTCTAVIENLEFLSLRNDNNIKGTVLINEPD